jgi:hypothetical protein
VRQLFRRSFVFSRRFAWVPVSGRFRRLAISVTSPKSPESWYWAGQVEVLIASNPQSISFRAEIPLLPEPTELEIDDRAIAGLRWTPKKWFTSQLVTVWGDPIE